MLTTLRDLWRNLHWILPTSMIALVDPSKTKMPDAGYESALAGGWAPLGVGTLDPEIWRYSDSLTKEVPEATEQIVSHFTTPLSRSSSKV
jgi:amidase